MADHTGLLTHAGGSTERVTVPDGRGAALGVHLDAMQALVGGYVEHVNAGRDVSAWVNDEGRLDGRPLNVTATRVLRHLYRQLAGPAWTDAHGWVLLFGPVLWLGGIAVEGDTLPLDPVWLESLEHLHATPDALPELTEEAISRG